jgi:3-deoxy-D-manno-octulosonate 8-phosphate phosphatase (KDO 8-P phosphatase)
MQTLEAIMYERAGALKEFWFDVDGVMTAQAALTIYDIKRDSDLVGFVRSDGITSITLVPCDEHGTPIENVVEYIAGVEGEPIMEGYRFDPRDGKVVEYLVGDGGFPVYFISGRNSPCVRKRALTLGATPLLGVKDKLAMLNQYSKVSLASILFIGDGIQDVEIMSAIKSGGGVTIAPQDACLEAKEVATYITAAPGGGGVLSEVITEFLKNRGIWPDK